MHEDPEQHWTELEHTPMRRWSYSAVRAGLIGLGILLAELTLRDHIGWPAWLRWLAYGTAVFVLRRLITPPDWRPGVHDPDDTTADLDSPVARTRTRAPEP
jgi:hypothetical protein